MRIVAVFALMLGLASVATAETERVGTRFGTLTIQAQDDRVNFGGRVYFNGRPLHPDVRGNNALYVKRTFRLPNADAVLFEVAGGEGCPYLWYIVAVSPSGAASTREFGSCGDLLGASQRGESVIVKTQGFMGPFEPMAARTRAAAQTHEFVYRRGVVTEKGKPAG